MKRQVTGISHVKLLSRRYGTSPTRPPIIKISNGTFYRHHPSSVSAGHVPNTPLFSNLNFELPSFSSEPEYWSILGPSSSGKTTFLQILRGQWLCFPPTARSYPYLSSDEIDRKDHQLRTPSRAIQYVGFGGEEGVLSSQGTRGAYLSARYESRREETDFSVLNYLQGKTDLNPADEADGKATDDKSLARVIKDLRLNDLIDMSVSNLSNGQTRRAKIARALLGKPEVLLLDEPFMGLDPPTLVTLSPLLHGLAKANAPRLVFSLRPQDPIPDWVTHLIYLKPDCQIAFSGRKEEVLGKLHKLADDVREGKKTADFLPLQSMHEIGRELTKSGVIEKDAANSLSSKQAGTPASHEQIPNTLGKSEQGEPLIEMSGVVVSYGPKTVLGGWTQPTSKTPKPGLWWTIRRGQRWGIFGPNGSGKTTLLSLICSDHPQTYSLPVLLFGRSRLPKPGQPGISIFAIQARMGHSSPEIHHHMPRSLTLRGVLENAWADTFKGRPSLDGAAREKVDASLRWFEHELRPAGRLSTGDTKWADDYYFGELPFSAQRVALFLRAVVKKADLVILDEAFSGMDDAVRDKCLLFLEHGERKTFTWGKGGERRVTDSDASVKGRVVVTGLEERQALLCISHVREEVHDVVREWICLPEANTGQPARFGKVEGPISGDAARWREIWGM